jgi:hypothetical protein
VRAKAWPGDRDEVEVQGLVAGEDGGKSNKRRWRSAEKRGPHAMGSMEYGVTMGAWVFTCASFVSWNCSGDLRGERIVEGGEEMVLLIGLCIEAERCFLTPAMRGSLQIKVYIRYGTHTRDNRSEPPNGKSSNNSTDSGNASFGYSDGVQINSMLKSVKNENRTSQDRTQYLTATGISIMLWWR